MNLVILENLQENCQVNWLQNWAGVGAADVVLGSNGGHAQSVVWEELEAGGSVNCS